MGRKHYVLGPDPDERLAFVDTDQTSLYYPMWTGRAPPWRCPRKGRSPRGFTHGPYGESSDPAPYWNDGPNSHRLRAAPSEKHGLEKG